MTAKRLSLNIGPDTRQRLSDLSKRGEGTVTDVVRRAVALYAVADEARRAGGTVQLVDKDGNVSTLVLL